MSHKTEDTLFLLGGALLGAAAMYLLDPDSGQRRRRQVADTASDAWDTSREYLGEGIDNLRDRASGLVSQFGRHASDYAHDGSSAVAGRARGIMSKLRGRASDLMDDAEDYGSDYADRASGWGRTAKKALSRIYGHAQDMADDVSDRASDYADSSSWRNLGNRLFGRVRDWGHQAAELAKDFTPDFGSYSKKARKTAKNVRKSLRGDTGFGTTSVVGTAVACCAVGAASMYYFDPVKGRARRAQCEDQIMSFIRRTGRSMNATGRHLSNKLRGTAYEARRSIQGAAGNAQQLVSRVRSELGRLIPGMQSINVSAERDGCITLSGPCSRSEADRLLSTVARIPGVCQIINRMDVGEQIREKYQMPAGQKSQPVPKM